MWMGKFAAGAGGGGGGGGGPPKERGGAVRGLHIRKGWGCSSSRLGVYSLRSRPLCPPLPRACYAG